MALAAAYIAGLNKESVDRKMFTNYKHKDKKVPVKKELTEEQRVKMGLLGKSKKFSIERFVAILDYFVMLKAEDTHEAKLVGHSMDYLATLNSLADQGLLKKSITKKSDSTLDDLSSVAFKCNFDSKFIADVAKKVNFRLEDYICQEQHEE
jgi:hypothetical protein